MLETTILVGIVVGLTQVIKLLGLNSRFSPAVSLVIGTAIVFLNADLPVKETIMLGIIVGLTASGLFSGVKKTVLNK